MIGFNDSKLCFLDLETTGMSSSNERIIEIGLVKTIKGEIVDKYEKLINPNKTLNYYIERLTGIRHEDLLSAPPMEEIVEEISQFLEDSILIAHNAKFDISFMDSEFSRFDKVIKNSHICSIKVARNMFPGLSSYGLSSIMHELNIKTQRRHRALDDAEVIYKFFKKAVNLSSVEMLSESLNRNLVARNI